PVDAGDVLDELAGTLLLHRLFVGPDDVLGGQFVAERALHSRADPEQIGLAVGGGGPLLREMRLYLAGIELAPAAAAGAHAEAREPFVDIDRAFYLARNPDVGLESLGGR